MSLAIQIENLSKFYKLKSGEQFAALKELNLEIQQGEVLGLIGPNGAGKSSLLKILSRISTPSSGRARINGKLASLLEVGTGFHPELSGKDNVFLNGAILGMNKKEIQAKYDEIVAFAGVEKFMDTQVKHYSSGMYVRLAFAVAAHLRADILLIDEVLAVGDAEFQKKCLSKIESESQEEGKTLIFVSHNMNATKKICDRVAYMKAGQIHSIGKTEQLIESYLNDLGEVAQSIPLSERIDRTGNAEGRLNKISIVENGLLSTAQNASIQVDLEIDNKLAQNQVEIRLNLASAYGNYLSSFSNQMSGNSLLTSDKKISMICEIDQLPLMKGDYYLNAHLFINGERADAVSRAFNFSVLEGDFYNSGAQLERKIPGLFIPHKWTKA